MPGREGDTMTQLDEEFERATAYALLDDDIDRARLLLGVETASATDEYVRTATPDAIRNFARGLGDDNPLYVDDDYGIGTRWGSQIAPGSMAEIVNRSEEHTSELQSLAYLVCRLLLEKKKQNITQQRNLSHRHHLRTG